MDSLGVFVKRQREAADDLFVIVLLDQEAHLPGMLRIQLHQKELKSLDRLALPSII